MSEEQKVCLVLMPFTVDDIDKSRYSDGSHWSEVYEGLIKPAAEQAGLQCTREDKDPGARLILESVLEKIEKSTIVLCDLSGHNPNVFLELGWALRSDRPFVLIKDDKTPLTFDLNQQYTFQYTSSLQPTPLKAETEVGFPRFCGHPV